MIAADGHRVGTRLAQAGGVSRQVANGYLQALVRDGLVDAEGTTRARVYRLKMLTECSRRYPREGLQEDLVWRELVSPVVARFAQNVRDIWHYAATEMINNAIGHSGAAEVLVEVRKNELRTEVLVADEGLGIFVKIQRALDLHDPREAILELAKGKLTTAPEQHTGEGIFFTSRALDSFEIESHHLRFSHAPRADDAIAEQAADTPGTRVRMRLANDSPRVMREVFDAYIDPEEFMVDKTVVPLRLAPYEGEKLVSRSQAKRVSGGADDPPRRCRWRSACRQRKSFIGRARRSRTRNGSARQWTCCAQGWPPMWSASSSTPHKDKTQAEARRTLPAEDRINGTRPIAQRGAAAR